MSATIQEDNIICSRGDGLRHGFWLHLVHNYSVSERGIRNK